MPIHPRRSQIAKVVACASIIALTCGTQSAHAAPTQDLGQLSDHMKLNTSVDYDVVPNRWLVEVKGEAEFAGGDAAANKARQQQVVQTAARRGIKFEQKNTFTQAWNGFTISASQVDATAVSKMTNVVAVYPVYKIPSPEVTASTDQNLLMGLNLTAADVAQKKGFTGKGIKVGIIDTGIDLDHPDLGGNGKPGEAPFPNARVKWGYDFAGDDYDPNKDNAAPDPIPDDCGGHGSHVAGIVGARGKSIGVAPDVEFGAYRVFGCGRGTTAELMVQAIERSVADGMDIINLSIGHPLASWSDYPQNKALEVAASKGVIPVVSAGNSQSKGVFSVSAPGTGKSVIGVASVENTVIPMNTLKYADKITGHAYRSDVSIPTTGTFDLVSAGPDVAVTAGTEPVSGCAASGAYPVDPKGKWVLVKRGFCSFAEKAKKAAAAGALGILIYNRDETTLVPGGLEGISIGASVLTLGTGLDMQAMLTKAPAGIQFTFTGDHVNLPNPNAALISDFSSFGLAADLSIKPNLAAPGGNIWSTYPLEQGGYANLSGTSMAAPHTAGCVALMVQARPELKGNAMRVRDILQNSGRPGMFHVKPTLGLLNAVHLQGAGLINVDTAIESKAEIRPGQIAAGESAKGAKTETLTVNNASDQEITYTLSTKTTIGTTGRPYDPKFIYEDASVKMPATVTVPAHGSAKVDVTITAPTGIPAGSIYGGYVEFAAGDNKITVPYAGMTGSFKELKIFEPAPDGSVTSLNKLDPATKTFVPVQPKPGEQTVFWGKEDKPVLKFWLEYPVAQLKVDAYLATPAGAKFMRVGTVFSEDSLGRTSGMLTLPWDGKVINRRDERVSINPGNFVLELKVLKALADPKDPASWESFTTPAFYFFTQR